MRSEDIKEISYEDVDKINNLIDAIDPDHKVFNDTKKIIELSKRLKESKDSDLLNELYNDLSNEEHTKNK